MNPGESLGDQGADAPIRSRKHGPKAQNRRQWSAERRARRSQGAHRASHARNSGAPSGAPLPSLYFEAEERTTASPAPQTIRAAELCFTSPRTRGEGAANGGAKSELSCQHLLIVMPAQAPIQ